MTELRGRRVLVVDDDAMVRFIIADKLDVAGCIVTEAADGADALGILIGGAEFDLMITDIRMPNLDGWTLAERARELRPTLPVLYVTGWSEVDARPVLGAEVLGKPFRSVQLVLAAVRLMQSAA